MNRRCGTNTKTGSLLAGLLVDADRQKMVPTYASKAGRRYRYYISKSLKGSGSDNHKRWRLPARLVEDAVVGAVSGLLRDKARMSEALGLTGLSANQLKANLKRSVGLGESFCAARSGEQRATLLEVVKQVEVGHDRIRISLHAASLRTMLDAGVENDEWGLDSQGRSDLVTIDLLATFKRRGVETKLILADDRDLRRTADPILLKLVIQARAWFDQLQAGEVPSARALAERNNLDPGDVTRLLPLAFLAPDIVEAILEGRQPIELTASRLKRLRNLPLSWGEQRLLLGFD